MGGTAPWRTVALGALALAAACDAGGPRPGPTPGDFAASASVQLTDAADHVVRLDAPPERIVSLVPSATRLLLALDEGRRLVGRTEFDTAAVLAELPSVGGGLHPSLETLVSLRPDLVIVFAGSSDVDTPARLDEVGIEHLAVRPDRIADVRWMTETLGRVSGRAAAADSLWGSIEASLAAVRAATVELPPVRTVFLVGGRPPWVAGGDTFVDELIQLAGGVNVFADLGRRYGPVGPEEIRSRPVEVVLVGPGTTVDPGLVGDARLERLPAAVELPGADLVEAARAVARALHPGALR